MTALLPRPADGEAVAPLSVVALVLDFVVLALLFNVVVPVFENPDESYHYFFAQHVSHTGTLPVQTADTAQRGPWEQEGSQPPLFHLLASPLIRWAGADLDPDTLWYNHQNSMGHPAVAGNENRFVHPPDREGWPWHGYALAVHLGRLVATAFGVLTVLGVWSIARRVLGGRGWLALAAAGLVAFNPQFVAVSATFSNDAAVVALATLSLALVLRVADGDDDAHAIPRLAIVAGLAPLAKLSGLAVTGFALLSLAGLAWRRRDARFLARSAGPLVMATAVLSGWWYVRNAVLYGDVTGLSHMHPGITARSENVARWLAGLPAELEGVWWSSWGIFGWFTVLLPEAAYRAISAAAGLGLVGLAFALWRPPPWLDRGRVLWLAGWGAVVAASLVRWMAITKGGHGRLLFPAIAGLAIGLTAGWRHLAGRAAALRPAPPPDAAVDRVFASVLLAALYGLAVLCLAFVVRPAFALAPAVARSAIPADAVPADVVFGDGLRLVAAAIPDRVVEGAPFDLTLFWEAGRPLERDGFVAVRVDQLDVRWTHTVRGDFERHDPPLAAPGAAQLGYPGRGNSPPPLLPAGTVIADRRTVVAPRLATPGQPLAARLSVHLYDQDRAERWPLRDARGADVPAGEWATSLAVVPTAALALDRPPLEGPPGPHAWFANGARLHRYARCGPVERCRGFRAYEPDRAVALAPGADAATGVAWTVDRDIAEDLALFVHLLDAAGRKVATFDAPPATHAPFPTRLWRAGDTLYAPVAWEVPAGAARGARYRLVAGLYRPADGSRVAVTDAAGRRFPDDAVPLVTVEVVAP
ncbi:hypothetical protein DCC79_08520 [bacterium]|nr:MAG: hypothetical protein DCC79_08520 [bacterium]